MRQPPRRQPGNRHMAGRIIYNYSEREVKSNDGTRSIAFGRCEKKMTKMATLPQHLRPLARIVCNDNFNAGAAAMKSARDGG
jgi:hypothetical protein